MFVLSTIVTLLPDGMLGVGTELRIPSIELCNPIIVLCIPSRQEKRRKVLQS